MQPDFSFLKNHKQKIFIKQNLAIFIVSWCTDKDGVFYISCIQDTFKIQSKGSS